VTIAKGLLLGMVGLVAYFGDVPAPQACSAMLKPTEVVIRESDTILRARVVDSQRGRGNAWGTVTLRVVDVLKGRFQPIWITVTGRIREYRTPIGRRFPYDHIDCAERARGCASCYAHDYKQNGEYLLFLKEGTPYWAPLSPTNEEVSGDNDPWVVWVKRQLAL